VSEIATGKAAAGRARLCTSIQLGQVLLALIPAATPDSFGYFEHCAVHDQILVLLCQGAQ